MRFCKYIANERQSRGKVGESSACRDKQFNTIIAGKGALLINQETFVGRKKIEKKSVASLKVYSLQL